MIRSMVVGTDGSDTARRAVEEARDLAQAVGAKIHLVSAYAAPGATSNQPPPRGREEAEDVLRDAAAALKEDALDVVTHAREGDPADAIVDVADETRADLIVIGNKGMTGPQRFLLGSVPNKISHQSPCSVLIVQTT